ncbi:hypothetical protein N6L27_07675 [Leisingera sp. SS27]|uniref:hypothetical protein n=1 Tax=Leisingera sp. SS27 TaxID=2979462 RepID=UPI00232B5675|nr:hypothetical protein [Leisingera sp. SS27]MDC0657867.1 hypothetical protein [Leisingera sp. SS27]
MDITGTEHGDLSIYEFTREKLKRHSAAKTVEGQKILQDKRLFLSFVRLERSRAASDFDRVTRDACNCRDKLRDAGIEQAYGFVLLYLRFSYAGVHRHAPVRQDRKITYSATYQRHITPEQILIQNWAELQDKKFGETMRRAMHWVA